MLEGDPNQPGGAPKTAEEIVRLFAEKGKDDQESYNELQIYIARRETEIEQHTEGLSAEENDETRLEFDLEKLNIYLLIGHHEEVFEMIEDLIIQIQLSASEHPTLLTRAQELKDKLLAE